MITLQSMMLILLGVLGACLAVIVIAPAYHRRVVRLTTDAIRQSVPITEAEIRADKDRLRAQFAIRVHKLESQCEQQQLAAARQLVEMNRKDARITELNTEIETMRASLEENVNARRVLEHTVTDRLPRLEQQLDSARDLIKARDQEMSVLKSDTTRSVRALDEALQINAQQRNEMERISSSLSMRMPASREPVADVRVEGEIALRSEIEALRAKTRDQAQLISRLQSAAGGAAPSGAVAAAGEADSGEIDRLRRELAEAQSALKSAGNQSGGRPNGEDLRARIDDQAAEIARLNAAIAAYEGDKDGQRGNVVRDSRIGTKAKISSLQAQIATQNETIQRLRAELAANNERVARQSAMHAEEMRRLGAGTVPTSVEPRRGRESQPRRSLSDRIGQSVAPIAANSDRRNGEAGSQGPTSSKVAEYLRALTDEAPQPAADSDSTTLVTTEAVERVPEVAVAGNGMVADGGGANHAKVRLLDRISGIKKS